MQHVFLGALNVARYMHVFKAREVSMYLYGNGCSPKKKIHESVTSVLHCCHGWNGPPSHRSRIGADSVIPPSKRGHLRGSVEQLRGLAATSETRGSSGCGTDSLTMTQVMTEVTLIVVPRHRFHVN